MLRITLPLIVLLSANLSVAESVLPGSETDLASMIWLPSEGAPATFPADFPVLIDGGGAGKGDRIGGFGGDTSLDRQGHREQMIDKNKIPVILVHGNGTHAQDATWGWHAFRDFLTRNGYKESEIWAVSYLGVPKMAQLGSPHAENIEDVRKFIDAVREYLDVRVVDILGHSLGAGMIRAYMLGYQSNGQFDKDRHCLDTIGTLVTLAGGNYGLQAMSGGEFAPGSYFEKESHRFNGEEDDTPRGADTEEKQVMGGYATDKPYQKVTELDKDQITFLGLWAHNDFVDNQQPKTGRLQGAHLNQGYNLGSGLDGHEAIIKEEQVFQDILIHLNSPQARERQTAYSPCGADDTGGPRPCQEATGTVLEHFREERIDHKQYFDYGREYGFFNKFTLYKQNGTWTDEKPEQCNDS